MASAPYERRGSQVKSCPQGQSQEFEPAFCAVVLMEGSGVVLAERESFVKLRPYPPLGSRLIPVFGRGLVGSATSKRVFLLAMTCRYLVRNLMT